GAANPRARLLDRAPHRGGRPPAGRSRAPHRRPDPRLAHRPARSHPAAQPRRRPAEPPPGTARSRHRGSGGLLDPHGPPARGGPGAARPARHRRPHEAPPERPRAVAASRALRSSGRARLNPGGGAMTPPRLGIGIIGAGRVGAVLGAALRAEGHGIPGAYAVSDASRARAEDLLPGVPLLDVPSLVERSEMLLLAVPDDELGALAAGIVATGMVPGGQLIVHTSGRAGTEVVAPLAKAGCATLAIHPAMTFTGTRADLPRLIGCPMGVTAAPELLPIAAALVVELGGDPVVLAEGDRPLYHAALAHGANHLVVLVDQAREALARLGIEDPGAYLRPLM